LLSGTVRWIKHDAFRRSGKLVQCSLSGLEHWASSSFFSLFISRICSQIFHPSM